ncbi:hypothetical protein AGMMS50293_19550 [Spirochaetia bacterium]|nr:hypothetical protein AGMMS50293_19550 [Spirochaetia bacterium]
MKENKGLMDYVKVTEGFTCKTERVFNYQDLDAALKWAIATKGPYVVEIIVNNDTDCDMGNDIAHIRHFE